MAELAKGRQLNLSTMTASGKRTGENCSRRRACATRRSIRPWDNPFANEGGLAILFGNLAPGGAVVKQSGVAPDMLKRTLTARVFESEEEGSAAILAGKIKKGEVIVIRYEGPRGGPGMQRDARADLGRRRHGPRPRRRADHRRALLRRHARRGDRPRLARRRPRAGRSRWCATATAIEIDIPGRRLDLLVPEAELAKRRKAWKAPKPKVTTGYLARYARMVRSAGTGAVLED